MSKILSRPERSCYRFVLVESERNHPPLYWNSARESGAPDVARTQPSVVYGMLEAGAMGYVVKSAAADEVVQAIRTVSKGTRYLSPALGSQAYDTENFGPPISVLGRREREVLALLAEGRHSREIAKKLGISIATVEVHRRNIMHKLELHSVAELTKYAIRKGLTLL